MRPQACSGPIPAVSMTCVTLFLLYPDSDGGRRGQSCIFFESVLAKKMRTDPAPVTDPSLFAQVFNLPSLPISIACKRIRMAKGNNQKQSTDSGLNFEAQLWAAA